MAMKRTHSRTRITAAERLSRYVMLANIPARDTQTSAGLVGELNRVARQLNERPRKTLDFRTPAERFNACVASTD